MIIFVSSKEHRDLDNIFVIFQTHECLPNYLFPSSKHVQPTFEVHTRTQKLQRIILYVNVPVSIVNTETTMFESSSDIDLAIKP